MSIYLCLESEKIKLVTQNEFLSKKSLDFPVLMWHGVLLERTVKSMNTLENLYYSNNALYYVITVSGIEYDKVSKLAICNDEALVATLTEQQKETFQKIKESQMELLNLGKRDAFVRGFSLGVKMMIEAMNSFKL